MRPSPLLLFLLRFTSIAHVQGEDLFTSVSYLQQLLHTETLALNAIRTHLEAEGARLHAVAQAHRNFVQRRPTPAEIQHPVRRYQIFADYTRNIYRELPPTVKNHGYNAYSLASATKEGTWPTKEDLEGSAVGLCRLVDTYNISLGHIGLLRSPALPEPTASDYVEVALHCLENHYAEIATNWAKLAIAEGRTSRLKTAIEVLSLAWLSVGNHQEALDALRKTLTVPPESAGVILLKRKIGLKRKEGVRAPKNSDARSFHSLCVAGGDVRAPAAASKNLRCRMAAGNPLLLLQSVKVEVVFPDPKIIIFHDFVSSKECEAVRSIAGPRLARAHVNINSTNRHAKHRISKVAFLWDHQFSILPTISRRISLVTGLSMESAAPYQVVNYGVGGHYAPHYDITLKGRPRFANQGPEGQRLATFLIYLSDVVAGGATAFVVPRIAVKPQIGMAVFWFNLVRPKNASDADEFNWNEARKGDDRTMHGSCPVLHGSKWIVTKWPNEMGQGIVNYNLY